MNLQCDCPLCRLARLERQPLDTIRVDCDGPEPHEPGIVQAPWLWKPLPWYRRYTRWDWAFLAVCLVAGVAGWLVVTR